MRLVAAQDTGLSTLLTPCTTVSSSPGSFLGGGGGGGGAPPTLLLSGLGCRGSAGLGGYLAWSAGSCSCWGPGAEFPLMTASQASSSARGSAEAEQRAARGSSTEIPLMVAGSW